jgi:hypothetical protein
MTGRVALVFGALLAAIAGGAVYPFGSVKQNTRAPLFTGSGIDAASLERIQRSCANCHSERVRWPWYSYVAPASWLIENDVRQARTHLNMSHWNEYSTEERVRLLTAIGAVLRTKAMPPKRYTALHAESALSDTERNALYEWAKSERRRLRALTP